MREAPTIVFANITRSHRKRGDDGEGRINKRQVSEACFVRPLGREKGVPTSERRWVGVRKGNMHSDSCGADGGAIEQKQNAGPRGKKLFGKKREKGVGGPEKRGPFNLL